MEENPWKIGKWSASTAYGNCALEPRIVLSDPGNHCASRFLEINLFSSLRIVSASFTFFSSRWRADTGRWQDNPLGPVLYSWDNIPWDEVDAPWRGRSCHDHWQNLPLTGDVWTHDEQSLGGVDLSPVPGWIPGLHRSTPTRNPGPPAVPVVYSGHFPSYVSSAYTLTCTRICIYTYTHISYAYTCTFASYISHVSYMSYTTYILTDTQIYTREVKQCYWQ